MATIHQLKLPEDQEIVDKVIVELNDFHEKKSGFLSDAISEEGFAIGIIHEVLMYYQAKKKNYETSIY